MAQADSKTARPKGPGTVSFETDAGKATFNACLCGCGNAVFGSKSLFAPGHDAKLRSRTLKGEPAPSDAAALWLSRDRELAKLQTKHAERVARVAATKAAKDAARKAQAKTA